MKGDGQSDGSIVPEKSPNKVRDASQIAEEMEERDPAKRNPKEETSSRTQRRTKLQQALDRIRQVASSDREVKFTAIWHHVYQVDRLRESFSDSSGTPQPASTT